MHAREHIHSQLLSLPPEIRNIIYRYALVQNGDIIIRPPTLPAPDQPSLLQVNRQIRAEARGIYYHENRFVCTIWSFDAAAVIKWQTSINAYAKVNPQIGLVHHGPPIWTNLLRWLEEFYCSKVTGIRDVRSSAPSYVKAAARMFQVVTRLEWKGLIWHEIKPALEGVRVAVGEYDARWLKDD